MWPASPVTWSASAFPRALGVGLWLPARASRPRPRAGVTSARWAAAAAGGVRPASAGEPSGSVARLWLRRARCAVGKALSTAAREAGLALPAVPLRLCELGLSTLLPSLRFSIRTMALYQLEVSLARSKDSVRGYQSVEYGPCSVTSEGKDGAASSTEPQECVSRPKYQSSGWIEGTQADPPPPTRSH